MDPVQEFMRKQTNHKSADDFKMVVLGALILSLIIFTIIGKDATKHIILYWAAGMVILMVTAGILDILAYRKDKNGR